MKKLASALAVLLVIGCSQLDAPASGLVANGDLTEQFDSKAKEQFTNSKIYWVKVNCALDPNQVMVGRGSPRKYSVEIEYANAYGIRKITTTQACSHERKLVYMDRETFTRAPGYRIRVWTAEPFTYDQVAVFVNTIEEHMKDLASKL